jgi:hypothetical protein
MLATEVATVVAPDCQLAWGLGTHGAKKAGADPSWAPTNSHNEGSQTENDSTGTTVPSTQRDALRCGQAPATGFRAAASAAIPARSDRSGNSSSCTGSEGTADAHARMEAWGGESPVSPLQRASFSPSTSQNCRGAAAQQAHSAGGCGARTPCWHPAAPAVEAVAECPSPKRPRSSTCRRKWDARAKRLAGVSMQQVRGPAPGHGPCCMLSSNP